MYVVASVDETAGFDFDRIGGGSGCNTGDVVVEEVGGLTIDRRTGACAGDPMPTMGRASSADPARYFEIDVRLDVLDPSWYSEKGRIGAPALVAGYQLLYATRATDPTSSDFALGAWRPVRSPADPSRALGVVASGSAAPITLALPRAVPFTRYWLATRLVYADTSESPLGPFDPSTSGPLLVSSVSAHCGPVTAPPGLCPVPPEPAQGLFAVHRGADAVLSWRVATDLATTAYNVWKVVSGARALIPLADAITASSDPRVKPVCSGVPRGIEACIDSGAVSVAPELLYYQVRGVCSDGSEGAY